MRTNPSRKKSQTEDLCFILALLALSSLAPVVVPVALLRALEALICSFGLGWVWNWFRVRSLGSEVPRVMALRVVPTEPASGLVVLRLLLLLLLMLLNPVNKPWFMDFDRIGLGRIGLNIISEPTEGRRGKI